MSSTGNNGSCDLLQSSGDAGLNRQVAAGAYGLALAVGLERAASFVANLLAVRIGGPRIFGLYSLVLSTANNVASYAGPGIGQTATRFSAAHPPGSTGHARLVKFVFLFTCLSIALAVLIAVLGARPLAVVLMKSRNLEPVLKFSALSATAILAIESLRGLLIGERRYRAMLYMAVISGTGLLVVLPIASRYSPELMIILQAAVILLAVVLTIYKISRERHPQPNPSVAWSLPSFRGFAQFSLTQLLQAVCMNTSGLWVTSMLARSDSSLIQLSFFAIASQFRSMVALAPGLLAQSSYPLLTERADPSFGGPGMVLTRCTYLATVLAVACTGVAMLLIHSTLPLFYGTNFAAAETAAVFGIATAMVHMAAAPAAARLSIVSLRATGSIASLWAGIVVAAAWLMSPHVDAAAGMKIYYGAHCCSALLVCAALAKAKDLPQRTMLLTLAFLGVSLTLVSVALWRARSPGFDAIGSLVLAGIAGLTLLTLFLWGRRQGYLPRHLSVRRILAPLWV